MKDFNEDSFKDLSIEEIDELYKDILEMPSPLIGGVGNTNCESEKGYYYTIT